MPTCDDARVIRAGLCLLLCSCNWVFGLEGTVPLDAQYFDAPPDAPWACPAQGALPKFSPAIHQADVGANYCSDYTTSGARGLAMAICRSRNDSLSVSIVPSIGINTARGELCKVGSRAVERRL